MSCQCKACLDQLASPQWLWFHEQHHHNNYKILACPHCDTVLPTKAKYFPAETEKSRQLLLSCPSCNRQDHLHLFLRRQTAFACGFCSDCFYSSSSSSSFATKTKSGPSSSSSSSRDLHTRLKRRFFAHIANELARNDELIRQGQPPREWSRSNVIFGLLQRPGIAKHWKALVVGSDSKEEGTDGGGTGARKIPAGMDAFFSWDDAVVHSTDDMGAVQKWLQFFDPEKDGDEKAAKLAELAFAQADKVFQPRAWRVKAEKHRTVTDKTGGIGKESEEQKRKEKSIVRLDKPLPELPTGTTSFSASLMHLAGLRSTDYRRNQERSPEDEEMKARSRIRRVVKQIEMALSAAYC
ncbi:hypothetical protein QBC32DRAFT_218809 [Pseudoneurospora amorphoporcata]|uniref:Uncharacterized protein n=1 Tax=Pseudoneurospora amorphoporcata TaxID=241081 RepID=A0AAN6NU19_9PEZI|nr:hypothetical protein QBC32DRAFT_218809 [Pseudoneurospora amorphoporcata]